MYWVKIKKDDLSMEEGVWTLSNVRLKVFGSFKVDTYVERSIRGVIRDGYVYIQSNDNAGIYKINLDNAADVTLIPFGFTSANKALSSSGTCSNHLVLVNDLIIGYDFQVKPDDTVVQTAGAAGSRILPRRCSSIGNSALDGSGTIVRITGWRILSRRIWRASITCPQR